MATATATAVTREILEDRWECATHVLELDDEWSKPMEKLDKLICKLYEAVTREEWTGYVAASAESPGYDGSGDVTGAVHEAVHRTLIDEIEKAETARREFPKPLEIAS